MENLARQPSTIGEAISRGIKEGLRVRPALLVPDDSRAAVPPLDDLFGFAPRETPEQKRQRENRATIVRLEHRIVELEQDIAHLKGTMRRKTTKLGRRLDRIERPARIGFR